MSNLNMFLQRTNTKDVHHIGHIDMLLAVLMQYLGRKVVDGKSPSGLDQVASLIAFISLLVISTQLYHRGSDVARCLKIDPQVEIRSGICLNDTSASATDDSHGFDPSRIGYP